MLHTNVASEIHNIVCDDLDRAVRTLDNLCDFGVVTDVTFIEPTVSSKPNNLVNTMEVYPPRRMVTYGQ